LNHNSTRRWIEIEASEATLSYQARYSSFYEQGNERQPLSSLTQTGQHKAFIDELMLYIEENRFGKRETCRCNMGNCRSTPEKSTATVV
jgi:hypothetical protein